MNDVTGIYEEISGNIIGRIATPPDEAALLADMAGNSDLHIEVGCLWGATAILAALAGAKQVFTVDAMRGGWWDTGDPTTQTKPTPTTVLENFKKFGVNDRVKAVRSNSNPWPLLDIYPETFFIDGDHSYEGFGHDWTIATQITQRAIIAHDVDDKYPGIVKALSEKRSALWRESKRVGSSVLFERIPSPLVSVIVPTYNRPELLSRALDSIMEQSFCDFEVIVVNDAGMDVADIVARYPKARYYAHKTNKGLPAARNTAIEHAKGHYIAYLDDDDWYYQKHLDTLLNAIVKHNARAAYSDSHSIEREEEKRKLYISKDYNREALRERNLFTVCNAMHQRSLFDEVGTFDETLKNHEDWDLWQRIGDVTNFVHINIPTSVIDRTRQTMNTDKTAMRAGFEIVQKRYMNGHKP